MQGENIIWGIIIYFLYRPLQAIAKIFTELSYEFINPIANWFQFSNEEAKHWRFFNPFETTNKVAVVVKPLNTVFSIFNLRQSENPSWKCQTEQFNI